MFVLESYAVAVLFCIITMFCWGSWANTQKLAQKDWRFELFYWDYAIGVLLLFLLFGLTLGNMGSAGRGFSQDLGQASSDSLLSAFVGGLIFSAANILLVAAIAIAGMAVAFPVGIGLALVLGVVITYLGSPVGNPVVLFAGGGLGNFDGVLFPLCCRRHADRLHQPGSREDGSVCRRACVFCGPAGEQSRFQHLHHEEAV